MDGGEVWISTQLAAWSFAAAALAGIVAYRVGCKRGFARGFAAGAISGALIATVSGALVADWFPGPALIAIGYAFLIPFAGGILGAHIGEFLHQGIVDSNRRTEEMYHRHRVDAIRYQVDHAATGREMAASPPVDPARKSAAA